LALQQKGEGPPLEELLPDELLLDAPLLEETPPEELLLDDPLLDELPLEEIPLEELLLEEPPLDEPLLEEVPLEEPPLEEPLEELLVEASLWLGPDEPSSPDTIVLPPQATASAPPASTISRSRRSQFFMAFRS
jgi:hypothetical protein